jgi:putative tryptophan/tyrosine transport system substrate-binding protein
MRRREFITLLGGVAASWPFAAHAQQAAMPVIGWLGSGSQSEFRRQVAAFLRGVAETGFVEGKTVAIEYRWAEGQYDRLPALAGDLVRQSVAVILSSGGIRPALAAKSATSSIPIVFLSGGGDPVAAGLVASFNQPGGNLTGVNFLANNIVTKQLSLLHELVPEAKKFGVLVNPDSLGDFTVRDLRAAVERLGLQLVVLTATNEREIDEVFAGLRDKPDALIIQTEPFIGGGGRLQQIAALTAREAIPAIYTSRQFTSAGGLISYGADNRDAYRQAGIYVGRILKGAKPADLPVLQPTKFDLVINLKTAKALGLAVPPSLLAIADEVIE